MQEWIVAIIVACAAWAVATRYAPNPLRQAMRGWAVRTARGIGWMRVASRFEAKIQPATACGNGCGSCGGCGPVRVASDDHRIAVATIKKPLARQRQT